MMIFIRLPVTILSAQGRTRERADVTTSFLQASLVNGWVMGVWLQHCANHDVKLLITTTSQKKSRQNVLDFTVFISIYTNAYLKLQIIFT